MQVETTLTDPNLAGHMVRHLRQTRRLCVHRTTMEQQ